jgi:hypothetical protein
VFTTALALVASLVVAAPVQQSAAADLSVGLSAQHSTVVLPGARYDVTVTNHGPDPLESATVFVTFEYPVTRGGTPPCAVSTKTMTCEFGSVPVGGTATMSVWIYYFGLPGPGPVTATATRTASNPPDPNAGNDTATERCWYYGPSGIPIQPYPPPLWC